MVVFCMVDGEFPIVLVKCRRGYDSTTKGQECSGVMAYNMSKQGDTAVRFKCVKCGFVWTIPVGGQMIFPSGA
jgi:hypothetical protein